MDFRKLNIPTLDGPNWGTYSIHLQAVTHILDLWELIKGEALGTTPQTYDLLPFPTTWAQGSHPDAKEFAAAKSHGTKETQVPLVYSKEQFCLLYGKISSHITRQAHCGQSWRINT